MRSLSLLLLLVGCQMAPVYVRELPPAELLQECPKPVYEFRTNGDLVRGLQAYDAVLKDCNTDKKALREWAEDKHGTPDQGSRP